MLQIINSLKALLNFKWLKIVPLYKLIKVFIVVKLSTYIILPAWYLFPLPTEDKAIASFPSTFCLQSTQNIEPCASNPDAGYAAAYLLESIGIPADGKKVYADLRCKLPFSEYVLPNGLYKYFREHGLQPGVYRGGLESLKARLSQGEPVIVLIGQHIKWQHYLVLVGYNSDENDLYFFDSRQNSDTNGVQPGNRTLDEAEFLILWDNKLPLFNHVYITANDAPVNTQ